MPREVLQLHIGQCGVQVSKAVWAQLNAEHSLTYEGKKLNVDASPNAPSAFFYETDGEIYVPRALLIDSETTVIDTILNGPMKNMFDPKHIHYAYEDAANNYARGKFQVLRHIENHIKNSFRTQTEHCDSLSTIMVTHAIGGGTGSGFTNIILECAHDNYPKISRSLLPVYPSRTYDTAVVSPYNACFAIRDLIDHTSFSIAFQNEAIYNLCSFRTPLHLFDVTYSHLNEIIGQVISSLTASLRFHGELNIDFSEFQTNLVPYPRISKLMTSITPIQPKRVKTIHPNVHNITTQAFQPSSFCSCANTSEGAYIACCLLYRGRSISNQEASDAVWYLKKESKRLKFVPWVGTGIKIGINHKEMSFGKDSIFCTPKRSLVQICNHTQVSEIFSNLAVKFDMLFASRSFTFWYIKEGLEEGDFVDAREVLGLLHTDYESAAGDLADEEGDEY